METSTTLFRIATPASIETYTQGLLKSLTHYPLTTPHPLSWNNTSPMPKERLTHYPGTMPRPLSWNNASHLSRKNASTTIQEQGRLGLFISILFIKMFVHSEDLTVLFTKVKFIQLQPKEQTYPTHFIFDFCFNL